MRRTRVVLVIALSLALVGCNSGSDDGAGSGDDGGGSGGDSISPDENNRYQLGFTGDLVLDHTGGLICSVDNGELSFDFSIDASSGEYTYSAVFPGFEPAADSFTGTFTLEAAPGGVSEGTAAIGFSYGPAPAEIPGVVRTAGSIDGSINGDAGSAVLKGSYACFLQDAEVGN